MFRVTHPFHPLHGQAFRLVVRRWNWGEDRVYYEGPDRPLKSLPAAWTSVAAADPFVAVAAGRAFLHIAELLELMARIQEMDR